MNPKDIIEGVIAKVQGEIGRFLILKERIMALPQGDTRNRLLMRQNDLEGRAMSLMSEAAGLKEMTKAKGLDILKLISGDTINKVKGLASKGTSLISEMNAHKSEVDRVTGNFSSSPSSQTAAGGFGIPPVVKQVLVLGGAAFAINYLWMKARRAVRP